MHIEPILWSQHLSSRVEHKIEEMNEMRRKGSINRISSSGNSSSDGNNNDHSSNGSQGDYTSNISSDHSSSNTRINIKNRYFNYRIVSDRLMASAIIDCVLEDEYGRLIPVEYKGMRSKNGNAYSDHKYQITFYAILLEDVLKKVSNEGYIHYTDARVRILITHEMKMYVRRLIGRIRRMVEEERLPPIKVSKRKCNGGCGYRYLCYGY